MMTRFFKLLVAALFYAAANGYALDQPESLQAAKVAVPGNLFAGLEKSRPTGAILETLDVLLKQKGQSASYIAMPTDEALREMQKGKIDIATVIVSTPQVNEIAWLSAPIITDYSLVMVPKSKSFPFNRVSDLHNKKIGARIGYQYPLLETDPKVSLSRSRSDGEMISALLFGKVDAILIGAVSDIAVFRTESILPRFEVLKMAVGKVPVTIAFSKKRYSQQEVESFNSRLAELKQHQDWLSLLDRNGLSNLVMDWPLISQ